MTRILAIGYSPVEFAAGRPPVTGIADTVTRDDLDRLIDAVGDVGERTVIAIYPAWHRDPSLQRLQTVRSALDSTQVLFHGSWLPPLAGSVLCALAAAVAGRTTLPGLLMAALPLLERHLLPVAHLRSVGRLRHPTPTMGQHLASWWPPSSFAVSWWPQPGVRRLRARDRAIPLPPPVAWDHAALDTMALAGGQEDTRAWARTSVAAPLGIDDVREVAPAPLAGRYWGTSRYWGVNFVLEAVAFPSDVDALAAAVLDGSRVHPCRWCGELVDATACPFCGMERVAAHARVVG